MTDEELKSASSKEIEALVIKMEGAVDEISALHAYFQERRDKAHDLVQRALKEVNSRPTLD